MQLISIHLLFRFHCLFIYLDFYHELYGPWFGYLIMLSGFHFKCFGFDLAI